MIRGPWADEEDRLIILAQKMHGNRFAEIAKFLSLSLARARAHTHMYVFFYTYTYTYTYTPHTHTGSRADRQRDKEQMAHILKSTL